MIKQRVFFCEKCKKPILDNEDRVNYSETNPSINKIYIELFFHKKCWIAHYNESLDKKIKQYSREILRVATPLVKEALDGNSEKVFKI